MERMLSKNVVRVYAPELHRFDPSINHVWGIEAWRDTRLQLATPLHKFENTRNDVRNG